jgi:hypothetical protein
VTVVHTDTIRNTHKDTYKHRPAPLAMDSELSGRNAATLVQSIRAEFPDSYRIEVYVLMDEGKALQVYSGGAAGLRAGPLQAVLTTPGRLYLFSVAGIPEKYIDIADLVASNGKKMQFCWITAPAPPTVTKRGSRELTLEWNALEAVGVTIGGGEQEGLLRYSLEGAPGEAFRRGVAPCTHRPGPGADFRMVSQGTSLLRSTVQNLAASHWYYWRVVYEYAGARFESAAVAINTVGGVPLVPEMPVIEIEKSPGPMLEKRVSVEYKLNISWPHSPYVGASIDKYMVQMYDVSVSLSDMERESMAPGVDSPKSKMYRQYHKIAIDENIDKTIRTKDIVSSRWRTVYCDSVNSFTIKAPPLGTMQLNFRLRAKNCHGWSEDWVYFFINAKSHPVIFPAGKSVDPRGYAKAGPAEKEPAALLRTQPSVSSSAPPRAGSRSAGAGGARDNSKRPGQSEGIAGGPGRHIGRSVSGVEYELDVEPGNESPPASASSGAERRPEPSARPPRGLRDGQQLGGEQLAEDDSVWPDDNQSAATGLNSASLLESEYNRPEKLKKLTDAEVAR